MKKDVVKCAECVFWEEQVDQVTDEGTTFGRCCSILEWKSGENDFCSMGVNNASALEDCESCEV